MDLIQVSKNFDVGLSTTKQQKTHKIQWGSESQGCAREYFFREFIDMKSYTIILHANVKRKILYSCKYFPILV